MKTASLKISAVLLGIVGSLAVASAELPKFAPGVKVDKFIEVPSGTKPARVRDEIPPGIVAQTGVVFGKGGDKALQLDLYAPAAPGGGPFPGVIVIHGGGWANGNRQSFRAMAQRLATQGFVAATIDYRLSGEAPFPAAAVD